MKHGINNKSTNLKKKNKQNWKKLGKSSMIKINVVKLDIKKHNTGIVH